MSLPQHFKINIPQAKIDLLKSKLLQASFPDELENSSWDLGCPLSDIKRLVRLWKTWDWREAERTLNAHPQFKTKIEVDGFGEVDIHFLHQRSEIKGAIPLLFVHGWPGTFVEVLKVAPFLIKPLSPESPSFHIIAPSLPNFGFSQGISKRGFALAQYAETCQKLMLQLGYPEYATQAGDWGFWITRAIGRLYPQSCRASHLNMIYAQPPTFTKNPILKLQSLITPYTENERKALERKHWFQTESRGYNVLQSTKPQTLSYAFADSPVALLAWIYEKLHDWSDAYPWTDEEILTWVSIYQFSTAGAGAPQRIYYEAMHTDENQCTYAKLQEWNKTVKLGLAYNPKDLENVPKIWGRTLGKVVYEVDNDRGGHFYAHECPELLVRDVREMFGRGGGAYNAISGKNGYEESDEP